MADLSLIARIERELGQLADDFFDPDEAIDSDGYDQSSREGVLQALDRVREILQEGRVFLLSRQGLDVLMRLRSITFVNAEGSEEITLTANQDETLSLTGGSF